MAGAAAPVDAAPLRPRVKLTLSTVAARRTALVFLGTGASNLALLVATVLAARSLGPAGFAAIGAMLALLLILSIAPFALSVVISRDVATSATGDELIRAARLRLVNRLAIGVTAVGIAIAVPAATVLEVPVLLFAATVASAYPLLMLAVPRGVLQGMERFGPFALNLTLEGVVRLVAVGLALSLGGGVVAVGLAPLIATGVALGVGLAQTQRALPLGSLLKGSIGRWDRDLAKVTVLYGGLFALANVDVLVAKARLEPQAAGEYSVAATFGKIVFFLPIAVGAVLVPLVARRRAAGANTSQALVSAIAAVATLCLATTALAFLGPGPIRNILGGSSYAGADGLLGPYGLAMTLLAVASVTGSYLVALNWERVGWLFLGAAGLQLIGLVAVPASGLWLISVTLLTGGVLVTATVLLATLAGRMQAA